MYSDLTLVCGVGRVELACHTNILVARSPVFRAMFQHDTAEAQKKEVEMTDVEPDVAEAMLNYIYTGSLHHSGKEAELLAAADKYRYREVFYTVQCLVTGGSPMIKLVSPNSKKVKSTTL